MPLRPGRCAGADCLPYVVSTCWRFICSATPGKERSAMTWAAAPTRTGSCSRSATRGTRPVTAQMPLSCPAYSWPLFEMLSNASGHQCEPAALSCFALLVPAHQLLCAVAAGSRYSLWNTSRMGIGTASAGPILVRDQPFRSVAKLIFASTTQLRRCMIPKRLVAWVHHCSSGLAMGL